MTQDPSDPGKPRGENPPESPAAPTSGIPTDANSCPRLGGAGFHAAGSTRRCDWLLGEWAGPAEVDPVLDSWASVVDNVSGPGAGVGVNRVQQRLPAVPWWNQHA